MQRKWTCDLIWNNHNQWIGVSTSVCVVEWRRFKFDGVGETLMSLNFKDKVREVGVGLIKLQVANLPYETFYFY